MQLKSNIREVIGRLQRLQAELPRAVAAACAPGYWTAQLRLVARQTLQAQLAQWGHAVAVEAALAGGVVAQVQEFVASVAGDVELFLDDLTGTREVGGATFTATWDSGRARETDLAGAADYAAEKFQHGDTGQFEFGDLNLNRARQSVEDWVMEEKTLGSVEGFDPDVARDRIERILGLQPLTDGERDSPVRQAAAERLRKRIQEFMDRTQRQTAQERLDAATAHQWLEAVALAWREYVRLHLPDRVIAELKKLNRRVAAHELL